MPRGAFPAVRLVREDADLGAGVLSLEEGLAWRPASGEGAMEVEYSALVLHAVCTDPESFPEPCVYVQLEDGGELRLIPSSVELVQEIFAEMCTQSALHPGHDGKGNGDDDGDAEMYDGTADYVDAMLQRLDGLVEEVGQFDDPPEEEESTGSRKAARMDV